MENSRTKIPDIAEANFREKGCNCSQAVLLALTEQTGLSPELTLRVSAAFGGGMGRLREVCGALTGCFMAAGLCFGDHSDPKNPQQKKSLYESVQRMAEEFRGQNGSILCRELLGLSGSSAPTPEARTQTYYKKRPCPLMVRSAAEIFLRELERFETEQKQREKEL